MTAEQQGSDESGEGLSEALRKAARDHIGLSEGEFWPSSIADAQAAAVERILADRLAAVQAESALYLRHIEIGTEQLTSAEAALATARREADEMRATEAVLRGEIRRAESAIATVDDLVAERDELRGRLAAVEALAVCDQEHGHDDNPARVYGHHGSRRTCIRLKATNEWVYDPAWEVRNG